MPNSLAVSQDGRDNSYVASIKIGSGGKEMQLLIDSGSGTTWVFGDACTTTACTVHHTFGEADSATLDISAKQWDVSYGSGNLTGVVAKDTFSLAGFDIGLDFGLVSEATSAFAEHPMDGLLGLGRDSKSTLDTPTLMDVLSSQNLLQANICGIHLSRTSDGATDGQLNFGVADTSRYSGDLSFTPSVSKDGHWQIPFEDASLDGSSLGFTGKTAIIDTGSAMIVMSRGDAQRLHANIKGSVEKNGEFTIPCDTQVTLQLTISGVTYNMSPDDFVSEPSTTTNMCESVIASQDKFTEDIWILGSPFLKNVYTVFDFDNNSIGTYIGFFQRGSRD
jgi:cathepsin D